MCGQNYSELTTLTFNVTAFDADLPADTLRYTLDSAPAGATVNATTGAFLWTPTEAQGPNSYTVVVRATDSSGAFDTEDITINVLEVNLAPVLAALPDVDLRPGDSGKPRLKAAIRLASETLTFSLLRARPAVSLSTVERGS